MFDDPLLAAAERLLADMRAQSLMLATAESCTGGLVAALMTAVPGSSTVFDRGFVTYSNTAKSEMLGIAPDLIEQHGAVSAEVARAMAAGALVSSQADVAVSITGIAGPDGGTEQKPVGLVHFALARIDGPTVNLERRYGDLGRSEIRLNAVRDAIALALTAVEYPSSAPTQ